MKKLILILIALVITLCMFTSCSESEINNEEDTKVQISDKAETATGEIKYYKSDVDTFEIDTPYAKLQYPSKWEDKCEVKNTEGNPYLVTIFGKADDKKIKLFDIAFGTTPKDGYILGTIMSNNKEVTVSLVDYSGDIAESYPSDKYSDLYVMAEDVNEIISGLVYNYDMVLS